MKVYKQGDKKIYEIKNDWANECGILNEKNIRNLCKKYMKRAK